MTDREKVIAAYECSNEKLPDKRCEKCPFGYAYLDQTGDNYFVWCNTERIMVDAIDLLRAQEPIEARLNLCESCTKEYAECEADKTDLVYGSGVGNDNIIGCPWYANRWKVQEPVEPSIGGDADGMHGNWWYTCSVCHEQIDRGDKYCRWCGRAVKWE